MKLARHPTISTALLQTVVYADLTAAFPRSWFYGPLCNGVVQLISNYLFWSIPLVLALKMRSRAVAACCALIGCGVGIFTWFAERTDWLIASIDAYGFDWARHTIESAIMGPISLQLRLESAACFFWDLPWADGAISPIAAATYALWLFVYVMSGCFVSATFACALSPKNAARSLFGLRSQTLLTLATLVAVSWLASTMNWIVERREFMRYGAVWHDLSGPPARMPWTLSIVGERSPHSILWCINATSTEVGYAKTLFPEYEVRTKELRHSDVTLIEPAVE